MMTELSQIEAWATANSNDIPNNVEDSNLKEVSSNEDAKPISLILSVLLPSYHGEFI
jgi:hypothetical protein